MISATNLNKSYGSSVRTPVLHDVSVNIEDGEFVAIIGTSGSGKTTLLNVIGGLDRDYSGEMNIDGKALQSLGDRELATLRNSRFGFVFQQFNLLNHLTAAENIALPGFFSKESNAGGPERANKLLDQLGIGDKGNARPGTLSGGQKQRVAIARALFRSPTALLCDEPTGSLDRRTGVEILEIFTELNDSGLTLILVTHEEHIAKMARRIIRMEDGRIVSDRPNTPLDPKRALFEEEE